MGNAKEGFRTILFAGLGIIAAGCGRAPAPSYQKWSVEELPSAPRTDSSNAFDLYAAAALDAEAKAGLLLDRVYFPLSKRNEANRAIAAGLALVDRGIHLRCDFRFVPTPPFKPPPFQRGWRLLGRSLVWRIESDIAAEDYPGAVRATISATKFGFDLCGGGASDCSLGLAIADEARRTIAPVLGRLQTSQLSALAEGMKNALHNKPPLAVVTRNEELNMMAAVQYVQDAYRAGDYRELESKLGFDVRSAVDYLEEMHRHDAAERPGYFQGFAAEGEQEAKWIEAQAAVPAADRGKIKAPKLVAKRPWMKFARHFLLTLRSLPAANDVTAARTSLLVLEASILKEVKRGKAAPQTLGEFPTWLTTDPFSGKCFIYHADDSDFDVYSVGPDLHDDGGETDESFTTPDLKVESSLH